MPKSKKAFDANKCCTAWLQNLCEPEYYRKCDGHCRAPHLVLSTFEKGRGRCIALASPNRGFKCEKEACDKSHAQLEAIKVEGPMYSFGTLLKQAGYREGATPRSPSTPSKTRGHDARSRSARSSRSASPQAQPRRGILKKTKQDAEPLTGAITYADLDPLEERMAKSIDRAIAANFAKFNVLPVQRCLDLGASPRESSSEPPERQPSLEPKQPEDKVSSSKKKKGKKRQEQKAQAEKAEGEGCEDSKSKAHQRDGQRG